MAISTLVATAAAAFGTYKVFQKPLGEFGRKVAQELDTIREEGGMRASMHRTLAQGAESSEKQASIDPDLIDPCCP